MSNMTGDKEGIKLWRLMSSSSDLEEQKYFKRVNAALQKYKEAWFTDVIAQKETNKNQPIFYLCWDDKEKLWDVSLFSIPTGGSKVIRERDSLDSPDEVRTA